MYAFEIEKPRTVQEAVALLADEDATALAGGQTLIPTLKQRLAQPSRLVSLMHVEGMTGVERCHDGRIKIRAGTTHAEAAKELAESYPALFYLASRIGDPAVRARGTIGGSLANDDPSACWPAGALASGATVVTDRREIEADDFFQGMFQTALEPGEVITEVRFPVPLAAAYAKFIQPASRFPLTAAFVAKFPDGVRVAITGASEGGVFRWSEAEAALAEDFSEAAVRALPVPDRPMISDLHGSAEYRAHLCRVMTGRAVADAARGARGESSAD